jgi:hypothetical protein
MDRPSWKSRLGDLTLEAAMVVFAVLVALAVDEWRAERELDDQVQRARSAIEAELRANRDELEQSLPTVMAAFDTVGAMADRLRAGGGSQEWALGALLPDFSDAAWETARSTGVMAHMDYSWVLATARVYETQSVARLTQTDLLGTMGTTVVREPELERVLDLQGQLFMVLQMYDGLETKYEEALDSVPGSSR